MTSLKLLIASLLAITLSTLSVRPALAATGFTATLTGAQEVPPVAAMSSGTATFMLSPDGTAITFTVMVTNMSGVTASHIHLAAPGVNGLIAVPLFGGLIAGPLTGVLATGTITAADLIGPLLGMPLDSLIAQINAGNAYVNVHTMANPGGEIRGQIMMQVIP